MTSFFYKPDGAWAADFIPFYKDGRFRLFYLQDWRNPAQFGEGTPWYQISTADFVHFAEHGEMLARGTKDEQDLYVFTGSVVEGLGRYHIFYTGHNPYFRPQGKPEQGIMHAVSDDLLHWTKLPEETFFAPAAGYEPNDWRDPFVFWNEEAREFWMLAAARLKTGPSRRRGCTALCVSTDLKTWSVRDPFYAPGLYFTHECPDLFKIGDWWYLVFSEFSERLVTRYRMSNSLSGPWITPSNDQFDGRAFYAAKTWSDGQRRYAFGWNPTREGEKDSGAWHWGGNLAVHEVVQEADGTLSVRVPETVDRAFNQSIANMFECAQGVCDIDESSVTLQAHESYVCAPGGPLPECCKIEATVKFTRDTRACGIALRISDDLEQAYYIRLEPRRQRLVFDLWPRAGDVPFMVELERAFELTPGKPVELKVFVDGTICEVYAAGKSLGSANLGPAGGVALSTRLYNLKTGQWGVFAYGGMSRFENVRLTIR